MAAAARKPRSLLRQLALGSTAAAVVGGGAGSYLYVKRLRENKAVTAAEFNASQNHAGQVSSALAQIISSASQSQRGGSASSTALELLRYTTCPFCGKVAAFMDFHRIPYEAIEVEPMFKSQIGNSEYKKLPQLRIGGDEGAYLVDSDAIVDALAERVGAGAQLQDPDVCKWRAWARESLVRHVTLNINRSLAEAWQGYAYIDAFDSIPLANKLFLKVLGAPVMYLVARLKTRPALLQAGELREGDDVRQVFHKQVDGFIAEGIGEKRPFHGGSRPDLADLDVYGVLQSVRFHEIYDELLHSTRIAPWLLRMDHETGKVPYPAAVRAA